jgi:hypothetical protein
MSHVNPYESSHDTAAAALSTAPKRRSLRRIIVWCVVGCGGLLLAVALLLPAT